MGSETDRQASRINWRNSIWRTSMPEWREGESQESEQGTRLEQDSPQWAGDRFDLWNQESTTIWKERISDRGIVDGRGQRKTM
eukprot:12251141-Heterocapsa_arctica.AAC.1